MLDISLELKTKGGEVVSGEYTLAGCLRRCGAALLLESKFGLYSLLGSRSQKR
jgi:hypothetical protein